MRAILVLPLLLLVAASQNLSIPRQSHGEVPPATAVTTTYSYDLLREEWVKVVVTRELPPAPNGSLPRGSNTIVIRLKEDEPVKEVLLQEVLIIEGEEPLLEIAGQTDSSGSQGVIRICLLVIQEVDAEELDIKNTEVVRLQVVNVVAEDDELDIDEIEVVNVIRCARGAASTVSLGVARRDREGGGLFESDIDILERAFGVPERRETGLRADRIRILGPQGRTGFIERLLIRETSVFGRIELRNLKVQDLVLEKVTLEDITSGP